MACCKNIPLAQSSQIGVAFNFILKTVSVKAPHTLHFFIAFKFISVELTNYYYIITNIIIKLIRCYPFVKIIKIILK